VLVQKVEGARTCLTYPVLPRGCRGGFLSGGAPGSPAACRAKGQCRALNLDKYTGLFNLALGTHRPAPRKLRDAPSDSTTDGSMVVSQNAVEGKGVAGGAKAPQRLRCRATPLGAPMFGYRLRWRNISKRLPLPEQGQRIRRFGVSGFCLGRCFNRFHTPARCGETAK
jgi:hypothetical protein